MPGAALAQGEVKGKYGDWDLRCDTPPGAQTQQCFITQFVTAEDRENVGLSIVVMKTADKQARILRVLAPLASSCREASGSGSTRPISAPPASCAVCRTAVLRKC
jgi:invasion protein IalB